MKSKTADISYLAKLVQLPVSKEEASRLEGEFAETLKVIDQLNELNTDNINATPQVTELSNVWREDKVDKKRILSQEQALSNGKRTHKGWFVVPGVLSGDE